MDSVLNGVQMDSPERSAKMEPSAAEVMWGEEDEEFSQRGVKEGLKPKPRFSYTEVKMLLDEVKKNRHILLKKFNCGVSVDLKKQKWAEITDQINGLGENHREVRQIMKKWADLKCDGKRRMLALRGPNGPNLRKKKLGPVERMVHRILMMSPNRDGENDQDMSPDEDFPKTFQKGQFLNAAPYSYLSLSENSESNRGVLSFDKSPHSSSEKELEELMGSSPEFSQADDEAASSQDLSARDSRQRVIHTYSRTHQNQNHIQSSPHAVSSSSFPSDAAVSTSFSAAPPLSPGGSRMPPLLLRPSSSSLATNGALHPTPHSSSSFPPPPPPSPPLPPSTSNASSSNLLPPGSSQRQSQAQVAQLASQSLQQQRAGRMLLTSVSQSMEMLAQSVQLLVESQQEFVQESLQLQRETVEVLRDFSNTALRMLGDKFSGEQLSSHHPPPPPPSANLQQHPAPRF